MADIPAEKPEHFSLYTVFPTSIFFRHDLTDADKMLFGLLTCMANHRGYAFPKNATLQKYLSRKDGEMVSVDTVSRRLKALESAGVIRIEGGQGGHGIRKIYIVGVDFSYLRKSAEVEEPYLRKSAEVTQYKKNNKNNNNKKAKASEEEINDWISKWAVALGFDRDLTTAMIADFSGFADARRAKGKPFLTIRSVSMLANKLVKNVPAQITDETERVARMRYMLCSSITHNWESVYPIDDKSEKDFRLWLMQEYGIGQEVPEQQDYF